MSSGPGVPDDSSPRLWHYVAPDTVANPARPLGSLPHPNPPGLWHSRAPGDELSRLHAERLDLNLQRFARAIEAGTTIAFLGSGWSIELGYPSWGGLMKPLEDEHGSLDTRAKRAAGLLRMRNHGVDSPSLLEVIQASLEETPLRFVNGTRRQMTTGRARILSVVNRAFKESRLTGDPDRNPYRTLLKVVPSIRRFATTNFDNAIETALQENRTSWRKSDAFSQTEPDRIALLSISGASQNRDHVFHCHGRLSPDNDLILTESDYKRWYLGDDESYRAFRDALRVLLQSNALFVGGYSLSDPDLVRTFRQLSVMKREPQTIFVLLDVRDYIDHALGLLRPESPLTADQMVLLRLMAEQEKFGACIFPFDRNVPGAIVHALTHLSAECEERLRRWHRQPCGRALTPHAAYQMAPSLKHENDWVLDAIDARLASFSVVTLCGTAGSAKYLKACQYSHDATRRFESMVFSTHGNEDVYFYLRRIVDTVFDRIVAESNDGERAELEKQLLPKRLVERLRHLLELPRHGRKPLLLIISGFEQFFDFDTSGHQNRPFKPRHSVAQQMRDLVKLWSTADTPAAHPELTDVGETQQEMGAVDGGRPRLPRLPPPIERSRLLLTTRSVRAPLQAESTIYLAQGDALREPLFTPGQLGLDDRLDVFEQLSFLLMEQPAAIPLAAAYVAPQRTPTEPNSVSVRLTRLVKAVRAVPVDRGTRVVKFVVDELDEHFGTELGATVRETGRALLKRLSCFNRPFREEIMMACLEQFLTEKEDKARDRVLERRTFVRDTLLDLRLLEQVKGNVNQEDSYVVHPLVKRYFRVVVAKGQLVSGRAFGLHSALSRGPFEDPGQESRLVIDLFNYFEDAAQRIIVQKLFPISDLNPDDDNVVRSRRLARAAFEVLRSNLSYNTVARWGGTFRDYLTLCSRCYDLVKNYAIAMNDTWCAPDDHTRDPLRSNRKPPLTAEEILWLLNEMGLAYYSMGALRDSLRVWTVAFEWQRVIAKRDPEQGVMYAASLYCNLGTMTLIMGRLGEASFYFHQAREYAVASMNPDLTARMDGFLARIANLRGDLSVAGNGYDEVIKRLGQLRNIRAQSYFMRYRGLLRARLGQPDAATDVYKSMTIAASEDHPDVVADAKYFIGRVYLAQNKASQALPEFRAALKAAKAHSMGLLETNALVGIASAELALGDAHAALDSAFTALRLANECLWGLRQVEALMVIGEAYVKLGEIDLGRKYLEHARQLAREHQFHLHDEDIGKALAAYPLPHASFAGDANAAATGSTRDSGTT